MKKYTHQEVQKNCILALKQVYDPEISVNIYDLGLIYELNVDEKESVYSVSVKMTMTSPTCPLADDLVRDVNNALKDVPGVEDVNIELVFEPMWDESRMSEEAKLELGLL
ncbi:MAG: metal-sulfur cluster assembly factor [Candidatus Egerieousia sp.]